MERSGRISNSSETLWLSKLSAKMKKIKNEDASVATRLYGVCRLFRHSMEDNNIVSGGTWSKSELI